MKTTGGFTQMGGMGVSRTAPKDVHEAFRATCYEFAPGVDQLAALMGVSPKVLYNKCNCNESSHYQPTARDLVLSQVITGDKRVTRAMAHLMGGVFVELAPAHVSDEALLDLVAEWMKEQGDLFAAFHVAYGDGRIDARDLKDIRKEIFDVLQAVMTFLKRMEAMQV